jgi:hypothetical protein
MLQLIFKMAHAGSHARSRDRNGMKEGKVSLFHVFRGSGPMY